MMGVIMLLCGAGCEAGGGDFGGGGFGGGVCFWGMLRRQSRRELDGDFISPSFSRLRESTRAKRGHNRASDYRRIFAICA